MFPKFSGTFPPFCNPSNQYSLTRRLAYRVCKSELAFYAKCVQTQGICCVLRSSWYTGKKICKIYGKKLAAVLPEYYRKKYVTTF